MADNNAKASQSLLFRFLVYYGTRINHPGKWRLHSFLTRHVLDEVNFDFDVLRCGLSWRLNPANLVESDLFWLGAKDAWELYHVIPRLPQGSVIFDVGANFGYYSLRLAKELNRECSVYSFEPCHVNHERLSANIRMNQFEQCVTANQYALSDHEGSLSLSPVIPRNTGGIHLMDKKGDVTVTTLDSFCTKFDIRRIDFIKIDVEGFEPNVLNGGRVSIKNFKPTMLIEINRQALLRVGMNPMDLIDLISALGYTSFEIKRNRLRELKEIPADNFCINVLSLPRES